MAGDETRSPLTVTRPVETRSSAARREARPESAIALASQTLPSFSKAEAGLCLPLACLLLLAVLLLLKAV